MVIKLRSDYAEAYTNRGATYGIKGEYDRAIADSNKAIELKPDDTKAYNNRGMAYGIKGEYNRAIADFNTAIELTPDYAEAYHNRGVTYEKKGEYDRAITDYNKAIELTPDYAEAYHNRGVTYEKKGEYDRAITDYNMAIELRPDFVGAYNNRGVTYHNKGEFDHAIANYNKVIELRPDFAGAYNNRGYTYGIKGEFDRAIVDFNKAIELNPNYAEAYYNRGMAYHNKGDLDRAIADYNKSIQLRPNYAGTYYNRGVARLYLQAWEKAESDLIAAKEMGLDIIAAFHNDYESVPDFEERNGVQLPEAIVRMLTPQVVPMRKAGLRQGAVTLIEQFSAEKLEAAIDSYRSETYVCFDSEDIRYYSLMKAWKRDNGQPFNLFDVHDLNTESDTSLTESIKSAIRAKLNKSKILVVLIGARTQYLRKFAHWEMEQALDLGLPIIGVNLNGLRQQDLERCPPVIRDELAVYVSFNAPILQHALENWAEIHYSLKQEGKSGAYYYEQSVYAKLGL